MISNLLVAVLAAQEIRFEAAPTNLQFILQNHPSPDKHMVETMPGGMAVFDYNNDGRPDIFFANGATLPGLRKESPKYSNRLFRNDGAWKFTDVTAEAGLTGEGYALGAAAGDFDNDGHVDLFVPGLFRNTLYRNLGNGKFAGVTAASKIRSDEWSVAGGWFDYDGDGLLDLLVTNYGRIDLAKPRFCGDTARGLRVYCHPRYFDPRPNQLYRNTGNGVFEDVSVASGIAAHKGRGMSIAFADYDADGRPDAFVTNDGLPNFLFRNTGKGKFEEVALLAGVALLDHGKPVASMGTDFRDYDGDGLPDIVFTALSGETFPIFRNLGKGLFQDATHATQMARTSNNYAGWGAGLVDFNNDGWKDLFTSNSHVNDIVEKFEAATYRQANTVFQNTGNGRFSLVEKSGLASAIQAHRGAVFADFDGDGRQDAIVTVLGEPAEVWRNVTEGAGNWIALRLASARIVLGAEIVVTLPGGKRIHNNLTGSVSYASSAVTPVHFGLGSAAKAEAVEIRWPSGKRQILRDVAANRIVDVREP